MATQSHKMSVDEIKKIKVKIKKTKKSLKDVNDLIVRERAMRELNTNKSEQKAMRQVWLEKKEEWLSDLDLLETQLSNSQGNKKWVDWVTEFESKMETLNSEVTTIDDKKTLLNQLVDSIEVLNPSMNEHELKIKFKLPYVDDGFEWNVVKGKKDGYRIIDGNKEISINGDFVNGKK